MQETQEGTLNIDVKRLLISIWSRKVLIMIVAAICALVVAVGTYFFIEPKYQSDILLYVNNNSISLGSTSVTFSSGELTAARQMLTTYLVVLKSRQSLDQITEKAGLSYSRSQLNSMISASAVNETEVFKVVVTSTDPEEACVIANTIAEVLPGILTKTIQGSSVEVIDYAVRANGKVSPSIVKNAAIGFFIGFALMCGYACICEILDDKIHGQEMLESMFEDIPVIAVIPHKDGGGSGYSRYGRNSYYRYGKNGYSRYGKSGYSNYGYKGYEAYEKKTEEQQEVKPENEQK